MTSINLKNIAILTACALILASVSANYVVYQSLSSGMDSIVFSIIGIAFDALKLIIIIFAGILWKRGNAVLSLIAFVFFLVLTLISGFVAFGFSAQSVQKIEAAKAATSELVTRKQQQLDMVNEQINGLAATAAFDIAGLKSNASTLSSQISKQYDVIAACPKGWNTKCINPATLKLEKLQTQASVINGKIANHARYMGLIEQQKVLQTDYDALISGGNNLSVISPIFAIPAAVFNVSAIKVKALFLMVSAIVLELGSSFLTLIITIVFTKPKVPTAHAQQAQNITPEAMPEKASKLGAIEGKKPYISNLPTIQAMPFNTLNNSALSWSNTENTLPKKAKVKGKKAKGKMSDTGTTGVNSSRYERLKKLILSKQVKPSIPAIKTAVNCNNEVAINYLAAMKKENLLTQLKNNQYRLINVV